jgi:hypothetical protein
MKEISFETKPRTSSMLDICEMVFDKATQNLDGYEISTTEDALGLVQEKVTYKVPYGTGSDINVTVHRPAVDTEEFLSYAEGGIDEKPKAEVWVQAPRSFLFNLANGEKYFADKGYFRVVILSDGTYLDVFSMAFKTYEEEGITKTIPDVVGSMLKPLPTETDWTIQELIEPK